MICKRFDTAVNALFQTVFYFDSLPVKYRFVVITLKRIYISYLL